MTINRFHKNHNFSTHKRYLYPLLTVHAVIIALLLTVGCGNGSGITPAKASYTPKNLVANTISRDEIELAWQDNSSDEDGFNIERKEGPWGVFQSVARVGANISAYSDRSSSLKPDTTYYYRVAYYIGNEVSEYSNTTSAATLKKELSLRKESGKVYLEEGEFLETEAGKEEGKGHSAEEECIQTEEIADGNQIPCSASGVELVTNADSPFMSPVVLGSLIYGDDMEAGLESIPGLTEKQFEEIKRLATFVQDSFLLLPITTAGKNINSEEERTIEIDRQANEIIINANQSMMGLLGSYHYKEFMKWADGVSKEKEGQYDNDKLSEEGYRKIDDDSMGEDQRKPAVDEGMH